jgi:hypothetical protein
LKHGVRLAADAALDEDPAVITNRNPETLPLVAVITVTGTRTQNLPPIF